VSDGEHLEAIAASLDRIERLLENEAKQRQRERYGMAKLHEELVEGRMMFLAERNHVLTWIATPAAVIAAIAAVVAVIVVG
jgi:hypothetical protein